MPSPIDSDSSRTFPTNRVLRWGRVAVLGAGIGGLLYIFRDLAQLVLVAALLAYLLNPLVRRVQRRTDRTTATLVVIVGVLGGGAVLILGLGPVLQHQVEHLRTSVDPRDVVRVVEQVDQQLTGLLAGVGGGGVDLSGRLERQLSDIGERVVRGAPVLLRGATAAILVPFVAVFLLRDGPRMKRGLIRFVPNRYFEFSLQAIHNVDQQLGNYFRGLIVEIAVITGLSVGTLWLVGVESFVLLGLLAGVTTVIPYAGSLLGGSVAVLVHLSSTGDPYAAALVLLAFVAIQVVDEVVIQPLVFARAVNLHPLEVLLAVWVGAQVLGPVGMIIAIPTVGAAKVIVTESAALIQQYQFH